MTACTTSCFGFAKVTCIAVDCKFHVAAAVFEYDILLCFDVIQQLLFLSRCLFGRVCGF